MLQGYTRSQGQKGATVESTAVLKRADLTPPGPQCVVHTPHHTL